MRPFVQRCCRLISLLAFASAAPVAADPATGFGGCPPDFSQQVGAVIDLRNGRAPDGDPDPADSTGSTGSAARRASFDLRFDLALVINDFITNRDEILGHGGVPSAVRNLTIPELRELRDDGEVVPANCEIVRLMQAYYTGSLKPGNSKPEKPGGGGLGSRTAAAKLPAPQETQERAKATPSPASDPTPAPAQPDPPARKPRSAAEPSPPSDVASRAPARRAASVRAAASVPEAAPVQETGSPRPPVPPRSPQSERPPVAPRPPRPARPVETVSTPERRPEVEILADESAPTLDPEPGGDSSPRAANALGSDEARRRTRPASVSLDSPELALEPERSPDSPAVSPPTVAPDTVPPDTVAPDAIAPDPVPSDRPIASDRREAAPASDLDLEPDADSDDSIAQSGSVPGFGDDEPRLALSAEPADASGVAPESPFRAEALETLERLDKLLRVPPYLSLAELRRRNLTLPDTELGNRRRRALAAREEMLQIMGELAPDGGVMREIRRELGPAGVRRFAARFAECFAGRRARLELDRVLDVWLGPDR